MKAKRWISALAGVALGLAAAAGAAAHVDSVDGLMIKLLGARDLPEGVALAMIVSNETGGAITLRGLQTVDGDAPVKILRRVSFFGFEFWQPVRFLRVEPGAAAILAPPDYRLRLEGAAAPAAVFTEHKPVLRADFGPRGVFEIEGAIAPH